MQFNEEATVILSGEYVASAGEPLPPKPDLTYLLASQALSIPLSAAGTAALGGRTQCRSWTKPRMVCPV